jgi:DNA-binding transcriptional regulator YiaG
MIIELEINGARVIISGDNLSVNVTQDASDRPMFNRSEVKNINLPTSDQIKALRKSRGESQAEFAKVLGTSQQNVHRWENGEVSPRGITVLALRSLLDGSES